MIFESLMRQLHALFSIYWLKLFFSRAANRALPIIRQIFKSCPGCDSVVRIAYRRIILIAAGFANIFFHCNYLVFLKN